MAEPAGDRLYLRQLLAGRDFAAADEFAAQMANYVYVLGDRASGDALLVDPAYAPLELVDLVEAEGMRCVGVLATHYHFDHVGGSFGGTSDGVRVEGVARLLERVSLPVHVQRAEAPWLVRAAGLSLDDLALHDPGDVVCVGDNPVELVHTPGHTPGSQCFWVDGSLVSGDTLFLQGCGRTDLPGGDPEAMYESLTVRLARIPDGTLVYPGHAYAPEPTAALGDVRRDNVVYRPRSAEEWLATFGR